MKRHFSEAHGIEYPGKEDHSFVQGKTERQTTESVDEANTECDYSEDSCPKRKIKQRKVAIVFGYIGEDYYGLQRQNGPLGETGQCSLSGRCQLVRTVEDEIVRALVSLEAISEQDAICMKQMRFQRAARTDKGVSARANFLSLRMRMVDDLVSRMNHLLPSDIKVFDVIRVGQSFDSKKACDYRTYSYLLPSFCLMDVCSRGGVIRIDDRFDPDRHEEDKQSFDRATRVLRMFEGTHNFHNFTVRRRFTDPSSIRTILRAELSKPFILNTKLEQCDKDLTKSGLNEGSNVKEIQVCKITYTGQSFMLNQIRRMVSAISYAARGLLDVGWFSKQAFLSERISILKTPPDGLYLNQVYYERYNRRFGSDGIHCPLDLHNIEDKLKQFEDQVIIPNIAKRLHTSRALGCNTFIDWAFHALMNPIRHCDPLDRQSLTTGIGNAYALMRKKTKDVGSIECNNEESEKVEDLDDA